MKKLNSGILCAVVLLAVTTVTEAITISIDPAFQSVLGGSTVNVDIIISELGDGSAPSVSTFDLDVSFEPSNLTFVSASFGNQLDILGFGSITAVTPGANSINLFELSLDFPGDLDNLQDDSFILAALTFETGLTAGSSMLNVTLNALGDSFGDRLFASVVPGEVETVVAIPPTVLLLGIGLVGLFGSAHLRRR